MEKSLNSKNAYPISHNPNQKKINEDIGGTLFIICFNMFIWLTLWVLEKQFPIATIIVELAF
jgi:hypothetical protein